MTNYNKDYNHHEGEKIKAIKCDDNLYFSEDLSPIYKGKLCGYINTKGDIAIPYIYKSADEFSEGLAFVCEKDGSHACVDKQGQVVFRTSYAYPEPFKDGLSVVVDPKSGLEGCIDKTGQLVIPCQYSSISYFCEGMACVEIVTEAKETLFGYINTKGEEVIDCKYREAQDFSGNYALVETKETEIVIDKKGKPVFELSDPSTSMISHHADGIVIWTKGRDYYFTNIEKNITKALPPIKLIEEIKDGLCILLTASANGKYGAIDCDGNEVIPFIYNYLGEVGEGRILYYENKMWGYLDYSGNVVIPAQYIQAIDFESGIARVKTKNRQILYINKEGEEVFRIKKKYFKSIFNIAVGIAFLWFIIRYIIFT